MNDKEARRFLTVYESACKTLATLTDAKEIRDKAIAMKVYARQAKNKDLEIDAELVQVIAERRLGFLIKAQKDTVGLNKGTRGQLRGKASGASVLVVPEDDRAKLKDVGIDHKLSVQAQAMAKIPATVFDGLKAKRKPKQIRNFVKHIQRKQKHEDIAAKAKLVALPERKFNLIYADPPWTFETFAESGQAKTAEKHYPTMSDQDIAEFRYGERRIVDIVAADALLFLWCTPSNMVRILPVVTAWGFEYKTHFVWVKDKGGQGLWTLQQHEPLLLCTRGKPPRPVEMPSSVIDARRGKHSQKPVAARVVIEKMFPHWGAENRIEFFARDPAPGWTVYGYEAQDDVAA